MTAANACHRYWDVELHPENYSYVDAALNAGYSILTYDRLGTGLSEKADAYTVVQFPVEVEILRGLTTLARTGNLVSASNLTSDSITPALRSYRPNKVVHVGHSLGSMTTMGLVSAYSDLTDGVILTGSFFDNETNVNFNTFGLEYAPANDPKNFADRSSGYLVQGTASAAQQLFLAKGSFEPEMLEYSAKIKQTICVGEMFSAPVVVGKPAPAYKGPVQVSCPYYSTLPPFRPSKEGTPAMHALLAKCHVRAQLHTHARHTTLRGILYLQTGSQSGSLLSFANRSPSTLSSFS
jgi:pimeloyl-ACP methyl ester carboxylesterase